MPFSLASASVRMRQVPCSHGAGAVFLTPSVSEGTSERRVRLAEFTLNDVVTRRMTIGVEVNGLTVTNRALSERHWGLTSDTSELDSTRQSVNPRARSERDCNAWLASVQELKR